MPDAGPTPAAFAHPVASRLPPPARPAAARPAAARGAAAARAAVTLLLGLGGCVATHKPDATALPSVAVTTSTVSGTPLGGTATPAATSFSGDALVRLDVTWALVRRLPAEGTVPLDARSVLTSAPLASGALLTTGGATVRVRFAEGDAAGTVLDRVRRRADGAATEVGHAVADLAPGTTARFVCDAGPGRTPAVRSFRLAFSRPADAGGEVESTVSSTAPSTAPSTTEPTSEPITAGPPATRPTSGPITDAAPPSIVGTLTVGLQGFAAADNANDAAAVPVPASTGGLETAYLDGLSLGPGSRYAFAVPLRFAGTPWGGLVVFVSVEDVPVEQRVAAAERLTAAVHGRRPEQASPAPRSGDALTLRSAIDALRQDADPRASLSFMAGATNAAIAADAILLADRPTLDRLKQDVLRSSPADATTAPATPPPALSTDATGWLLDRTALLTLCGDEKHPPSPELASVLVVHAGETGRHPDALADIVKAVGSAADLHTRLVAENYIALEDNAPAARVRAFDWLAAQGRAPAGFDPLGDAKGRRDAINRALTTNGAAP